METTSSQRSETAMPCEVFNEPSPERIEQLRRLKIAISDTVKTPFWGCTQVCDISKIPELVNAAFTFPLYFDLLNTTSLSIPLKWIQRGPRDVHSGQSTPSDNPCTSTESPRLSKSKRHAKERDGGRCILTGTTSIKIANIFPYCMINPSKKTTNHDNGIGMPWFWKLLEFFFERERLDSWKHVLFTDPTDQNKLSDGCHNNICLSPSAYVLWIRGMFALRPVELSPDGTTITVEFYWQPRPTHGRFDSVDLLEKSGSSRDLNHANGAFLDRMDNNGNLSFIRSGDVFTITTDDPIVRPLPCFEILDMQWCLNRIVSMSGAAEIFYEDDDDDDDDDGDDGDGDDDYDGYISDDAKVESLSDISDISEV